MRWWDMRGSRRLFTEHAEDKGTETALWITGLLEKENVFESV